MESVRKTEPLPLLSHWSLQPIDHVRSIEQPASQDGWAAPYKPTGLWVSVDGEDDWRSWCESEDFDGVGGIHYRVILNSLERVLWIDNTADLLMFTDRYHKTVTLSGHQFPKGHYIDWQRVAEDYAGLIVAPYQWGCRLRDGTHWYYGWDCASGCIWDAGVIERLETV